MTRRRRLWPAAAALLLATLSQPAARADDSAVVLVYHRVDDHGPASTSVSRETFAAHLNYLAERRFHVMSLNEVLRDVAAGRPLPPRTVAITFDDAYASVYDAAYPMLRRRGWPFTVFVATDYIDRGYHGYATWAQLRDMTAHGAELGNHTRSHPHMVRRLAGEDDAAWLARLRSEVMGAQRRLREAAGAAPTVFAYPYGEYTAPIERLVAGLGLYGVGQQSGAIGPASDVRAAPRFPMAASYAAMAQFKLKVNARPLPVTVLAPADGLLGPGPQRPVLRLRLGDGPYRRAALACYATGQGVMDVERRPGGLVVVRPRSPLNAGGRYKYNCTAPALDHPGVYYWYSFLWMKRDPDGSWYDG